MLEDLDQAADKLEAALDAVVSANDWWLDVPFAFTDDDLEAGETVQAPFRLQATCGFCGSEFCPLDFTTEHDGYYRHSFWRRCYYQPGYWFGDSGNGRHFPVCSGSCEDALRRVLEKRRWHTAEEMQKIARARRLVKECRTVAKRLKHEKPERCTAVVSGSR